jgi:hypothetical protein
MVIHSQSPPSSTHLFSTPGAPVTSFFPLSLTILEARHQVQVSIGLVSPEASLGLQMTNHVLPVLQGILSLCACPWCAFYYRYACVFLPTDS